MGLNFRVRGKGSVFLTPIFAVIAVVSLQGCSKQNHFSGLISGTGSPVVPKVEGPAISAGSIPDGKTQVVTLSNGAEIVLHSRGGVPVFTVEGTWTEDSFSQMIARARNKVSAERHQILAQEMDRVLERLKDVHGVELSRFPEAGYFTFEMPYQSDLMSRLRDLKLSQTIMMNPVAHDPGAYESIKAFSPAAEGLVAKVSPRHKLKGMSGLDRMHAPEFVKLAEADIGGGIKVNGSTVRLGIADTGITLNHPNFMSVETGQSRVVYMRDFTKEGRVYFNKNAKFEVTVVPDQAEDLIVNAEVLLSSAHTLTPEGNKFTEVSNLRIKVSPELKEILTKPGSGVKLGILSEEAFQSEEDPVDLNGNGKKDDRIYLLLVPGADAQDDHVYVDTSATGDFRNSKPVGDWNKTHDTVSALAEKFGFDFREENLPSTTPNEKIAVRSVSLVGFDPGNHGTHVAGIAAGSRTIQNDAADTLARGVAPEAKILMNRVCANNGGCSATAALVDLVLRGHADVINMSLGGLNAFNDGNSVQDVLINRLSKMSHTLFVISAGNSGPGRQTVGRPSTASAALSVGATATKEMIQRQYTWPGGSAESEGGTDFMLFFSSRGPTASGGFKPNITAPGTELSSIQLNSAQGAHSGMDVYWGTSMAAPAATGAYALLLDAVRKYNVQHPDRPLVDDSRRLREVLLSSARPFDVSSFNPETKESTDGQYTWVDQGRGMVDLTGAWKLLFELRDNSVPGPVVLDGVPVELDYEIMTPLKAPNGIAYDGSLVGGSEVPGFGKGLYLNYYGTNHSFEVGISRKLPEDLASGAEAGNLLRQLRTTMEEFQLKTSIYGSKVEWVRPGTLGQTDCAAPSSFGDVANVVVLGEGASVKVNPDGSGAFNPIRASLLNVCIDREKIENELQPGDHGALIYGYRIVDGKTARVPSFVVPVYMTVPHHSLQNSLGYSVQGEVDSFAIKRNYVHIPKGTNLVRVTLEVPEMKKGDTRPQCSGVELMALTGSNTAKPFRGREQARVSNCTSDGAWIRDPAKLKISFTVENPKAGIWDLPVFGSYKYPHSKYHLKVDYVMAAPDVEKIEGGVPALNGALKLKIKESSLHSVVNLSKSSYQLSTLEAETKAKVKKDEKVFVPGQNGVLRSYAPGISSVVMTTGNSNGNDIDLYVFECDADVKDPTDPKCELVGASEGPTDEELVRFVPQDGKVYAVRVDGAVVKGEANFTLNEMVSFPPDDGSLDFHLSGEFVEVNYSMSPEKINSSEILGSDLFKSGYYKASGTITLRDGEESSIAVVPVLISVSH